MSSPEGSQQKGDISGYLRRYTDNVWTNIGRERDGVAPEDVQQSVALRPPDHVTSYVRLAGSSNKARRSSHLHLVNQYEGSPTDLIVFVL